MDFLIVIALILGIAGLWLVSVYNRLITLRNRTQEAWSDIDVQLKRRHDLIPNLVETVKGYATHEKEIFEKVSTARSLALGAKTVGEKAQAENILSGTLKTLFAVTENYPDLKASQNFLALQQELSDTENKIQASRRFYNTNVRDFNIQIEVFPANLVAGTFNFKKQEFFEIEEPAEKQPVQVKF
ncbi:MAG: LemA family protein [Candidatus Parcubacteria bacterium]|nr:LemA family protein [Candidatus Parcubacteria bacterium]